MEINSDQNIANYSLGFLQVLLFPLVLYESLKHSLN